MSATSSKAIGFFTLGAVGLAVLGILVFGSGKFFKQEAKVEMMFEGNVKGLLRGSAITFRGVRVGEVTGIELLPIPEKSKVAIHVRGVVRRSDTDIHLADSWQDKENMIEFMMKNGLKAQLVPESMVTGRLQIQLEFQPKKAGYELPGQDGYVVIPTVPTEFEIFSDTVSNLADQMRALPLKQIAEDVEMITGSVRKIVSSEELGTTMQDLAHSAHHLRVILSEVDASKEEIKTDLADTTQSIRTMAGSLSRAADSTTPVMVAAQDSLKNLDRVLVQAGATLESYEQLVEPGSELSVTMIQTLKSFEATSGQVRQLAETLQRNPESVLTGKKR